MYLPKFSTTSVYTFSLSLFSFFLLPPPSLSVEGERAFTPFEEEEVEQVVDEEEEDGEELFGDNFERLV